MNGLLQQLVGQDRNSASDLSPETLSGTDKSLVTLPDIPRLVGLFIWLGIIARVVRYYLCFPLWDDESFLCVNFINRSYAELLQPLDYHQVAPILFLWIERTCVRLFGFNEYALRLIPFVCSLASLFLFRRVAERLLSGPALVFAVAIFAVSYPGIRYAAEAKPYCTDMFVSLAMLVLVVEWCERRDIRFLGLLAAMMPLALGVSYPSVFAAGGLSLVVAGCLIGQRGTFREWVTWSVLNVTLVASFVLWFQVVGKVQNNAEGEFMGEYWKQNFPPVSQPWLLPFWILKTHASDFLAYPLGGPNWASSVTLILCLAGLWQFCKRRQFLLLGLVLAPASLHLLAAALQRYPYGGHVKFSQYLAPMICCLAAVGLARFVEWRLNRFDRLDKKCPTEAPVAWALARAEALPSEKPELKPTRLRLLPETFTNSFAVCTLILACVGGGSIVRDLVCPYKTRSDFRARAFAQSFWSGAHSAEEVACIKGDLGLDFVPRQHQELSWSAHYLCNHAIEVSRSALPIADVKRISTTRPLRCVLYRDARYELDQAGLNKWLSEMKTHYELVGHESLPFPRRAKNDRRLITMEYIDSYKFVPLSPLDKTLPPLAESAKAAVR